MRMLLQNNIAAAILAGAAVIVCVCQIVVGDDIFVRAHYAFGVVLAVLGKHANVPPELSFMFAPLRLLTSLLLHENFLVLSVNVGALLLFGRTAEIACKPLRAGGIFLCGGIFCRTSHLHFCISKDACVCWLARRCLSHVRVSPGAAIGLYNRAAARHRSTVPTARA